MAPDRRGRRAVGWVVLAAALLLWPALLNGYPLVFSDTGTYLGQAIERYLGWDRPAFYSVFILPLHMLCTTWPVVVAQALITAQVLHLALRALRPDWPAWSVLPASLALATGTALPFVAAQLTPDASTSLLALVLTLLALVPDRLWAGQRVWLVLFGAALTTLHLSNLPVAVVLPPALLLLRAITVASPRLGREGLVRLAAPALLGISALLAVNWAGLGRPSLAPFGNVFVLARVIYDGPGARVLLRDCPAAGWALCRFADRLPPSDDTFLWSEEGPVIAAGGAKQISTEADTIIAAAIGAKPLVELRAIAGNGVRQMVRFATGDGLNAWPRSVTPVIERHFPPREVAAYRAARQSRDTFDLPDWLLLLHRTVALAGLIGCATVAAIGLYRRDQAGALCAGILLVLAVNAVVTGGLSGPHDRYQARVAWLAPFAAGLAAASLNRSAGRATARDAAVPA
jgi:hypothetical protein